MFMSSVMLVLAAILICMGVKQYLEAKKTVSRIDTEAMGVVSEVEEENSDKNGMIYRMIYSANINGESVQFHDRHYRKRRKCIGTPVTIRYEEGNFCNFTADKIDRRYQIPLTFCVMGVVFIIFAIVTYFKYA